ncbi:CAP domain-containing protein [Nostoc sp. 'Lobaria pulmonaria (5183) cyanobiont']|uniref:CAP domain-containing protein n=1 Tax=Nostoc sp. 'Lobaria pulmonaria (5183) cyanobiont' TaxID=1618022 RepID=UPI000CF3473B|nr:CAP domain-containing protein [Nostoc sp. 'Lobaria pulmonaria (5183) cyanobiont']AVH72185.1 SCP domain-containing protein [Nostoc sp. 'Lobaria pulmonaria (5183) cyanobiont']
MIKPIIYSVALGTIILSSGAIATPVTNPAFTPMVSNVSNSTVKIAASSIDTAALEQSIFNQINNYRISQGLSALTRNAAIDNQVRIHSQNMANGTVPFGHTGFSERVKATRISYRAAGENVAYNQGYSDPATIAVQGWLKSPGHLANIRGNYNLTGIGVAKNSQGAIYFTQMFIRS